MLKKEKALEKSNFTKSEIISLVTLSLIIGLTMGILFNKTNVITKNTIVSDENLQELIENYEYIINNYYEEVDKRNLINSAIEGMMGSLEDPHSMYFDENESENFSITLDGEYKGMGIQIAKDLKSGNILVLSVFKNSPAEEAGLIAGDQIIKVDDLYTKDYTADEFSKFIKESDKNNFELKVLRENKEITLTLEKRIVTLESIYSDMYVENDKNIGYIYIGIFANNTYEQFKEALEKLEKDKIDSLIIDVRGNTGGHLTTVDSILNIFLTNKQKKYGFEQNNKTTFVYGKAKTNKEYNIVLLGDSLSASASEVLISSLKENLGSKFFGTKTYGKGTVQELITLSDGTQYKLTIKKWLTPNGNWINDTNGVVPDYEIETDDEKYLDIFEKNDSQLNYAIKYLSE